MELLIPRPIYLMGMPIHPVTEAQSVDLVMEALRQGRGGWVITPNLDHLRRYHRDGRFAACFREAQLIVADGMPLVWASQLAGERVPERVPGSGLISTLSAAAVGKRVFLLGGDPGAAQAAGEVLVGRFPKLAIAGTACPIPGFEHHAEQIGELARQLSSAEPDIVFVALGSPKQEFLIHRLRPILPRAWWLGVGMSFSFLCGQVRRAPRWMQQCGMEWLHRLVQEPRRLAKRYLAQDMPFAARLFATVMYQRLLHRPGDRPAGAAG